MSWIRKRDLHIMTIGILTYTNDQRYQALHTEGSDEWSLRVMSAQPRDSGVYECQVSTEPKISQAYRLNVVGELSLVQFFFLYTRRQPDAIYTATTKKLNLMKIFADDLLFAKNMLDTLSRKLLNLAYQY